jgi:hypothetical protein
VPARVGLLGAGAPHHGTRLGPLRALRGGVVWKWQVKSSAKRREVGGRSPDSLSTPWKDTTRAPAGCVTSACAVANSQMCRGSVGGQTACKHGRVGGRSQNTTRGCRGHLSFRSRQTQQVNTMPGVFSWTWATFLAVSRWSGNPWGASHGANRGHTDWGWAPERENRCVCGPRGALGTDPKCWRHTQGAWEHATRK